MCYKNNSKWYPNLGKLKVISIVISLKDDPYKVIYCILLLGPVYCRYIIKIYLSYARKRSSDPFILYFLKVQGKPIPKRATWSKYMNIYAKVFLRKYVFLDSLIKNARHIFNNFILISSNKSLHFFFFLDVHNNSLAKNKEINMKIMCYVN